LRFVWQALQKLYQYFGLKLPTWTPFTLIPAYVVLDPERKGREIKNYYWMRWKNNKKIRDRV